MNKLVAHVESGLTNFAGFERAANIEAFAGRETFSPLRFAEVELVQSRLGIKRIDLAGPAFHKQHNHGFGFGRMHGRLG